MIKKKQSDVFIKNLSIYIIDNKSVLLPIHYMDDVSFLFQKDTVEQINLKYKIPVFSAEFFTLFIQTIEERLLNGVSIDSLTSLEENYRLIEEYFTLAPIREFYTQKFLKNQLLPQLIRGALLNNNSNLIEYIDLLYDNNKDEWALEFVNALSWIVFELPIKNNDIIKIFRKPKYQYQIGYWEGITYCVHQQQQRTHIIIELILSEYSQEDIQFLRCLLNGLYLIDTENVFSLLASLMNNEELRWLIFNIITFNLTKNQALLNNSLILAESIPNNDILSKQQCAQLYALALANRSEISEEIISKCENGIMLLINDTRQELQNATITAISQHLQNDNFVHKMAILLIKNPNHNPVIYEVTPYQHNLLDGIYTFTIKDTNIFCEFLKEFVQINKERFNEKRFNFSISKHFRQAPDIMRKHIVKFLIDDLARVRLLGNVLLDNLVDYNSTIKLDLEINGMSEDEQSKLILTLNYWMHLDYSKRLRLLMPIFKSNYISVIKLLIEIINQKFDDHSNILEMLIVELPEDLEFRGQIIDILKQRQDELFEFRKQKRSIKELSPSYCQSLLYKYFAKLQRNKFSADVHESINKDSLPAVLGIKKIQLAKGGGWRLKGQDQIQPLSRVETIVHVPASLYHYPEWDTMNFYSFYSDDWSNLNDWKQWLRKFSSENI